MSLFHETLELIDRIVSVFSSDDYTKGILIAVPHYLAMLVIIVYIVFGEVSHLYYGVVAFLLFVFITNVIYRGCILIKCERRYFGNKEWYGGYEVMRWLGIPIDDASVKVYYGLYVLMVAGIIGVRLYKHIV